MSYVKYYVDSPVHSPVYDMRFGNGNGAAIIIGHATEGDIVQTIKEYAHFWSDNEVIPEWVFNGYVDGKASSIRKRFQRILTRLKLCSPATKRILVHCDKDWLRHLFPDLEGHNVGDVHGAIFTVDEIEVCVTFPLQYSKSIKYKKYAVRDLVRFNKLHKWAELTYTTDPLPKYISGRVVMDFETTDISAIKLGRLPEPVTIAVQYLNDKGEKVRHLICEGIQEAIDTLTANAQNITDLVGHNIQFDLNLTNEKFRRAFYGKVRDTVIRSRARGEPESGLKFLTTYYTKRPGHYVHTNLRATKVGVYKSTTPELVPGNKYTIPGYVCEDLESTWLLFDKWQQEHIKRPVIALMEKALVIASCQTYHGTHINRDALEILDPEVKKAIQDLRTSIEQEYGCPAGSQALMQKLNTLGYKPKWLASGGYSITKEWFKENELQDMADLITYEKLGSSFVYKFGSLLREDDTITHHQGILSAETGRTNMGDYNHQQSPRKGPIRALYNSRFYGGKFFSFDFSQAELRVAAWISNCLAMALWLMGTDAHREIASKAFGVPFDEVTDEQRQDAKTVAFRTIFGGWPTNEGQKVVRAYMKQAFPEFFEWLDSIQDFAATNQYVCDPWGKTRNLRGCWDFTFGGGLNSNKLEWKRKAKAGREGVNSPIQGWASHLSIWVMVRLQELFWEHNLQSFVLFGVHDSINCDVHPDEVMIVTDLYRQAMAEIPVGDVPMSQICPLVGELQIADTWADTKTAPKIKMSSGNAPGICHPSLAIIGG